MKVDAMMERTFWVAIRDDYGYASIDADDSRADYRQDIKNFFRRNAGNEIRKCSSDEMLSLLRKHPKMQGVRQTSLPLPTEG